jgi:hypothetical protein
VRAALCIDSGIAVRRHQASRQQADLRRFMRTNGPNVIVVKDEHHNLADLLIGVRGMDPAAQVRCVSAELRDFSLNIIAPEDLIGMKLFAGGPQDLIDVEGILQVSGGELDLQLLRDVARRYGPDIERKLEGLRPPP